MGDRALASIQKILKLTPIEGADRIEIAQVEGWEVIVQKGLYNEGDLCVYFEIDSIVPADSRFDCLERYKYRIRTIKLRGAYSQGFCLPITQLTPSEIKRTGGSHKLVEGVDLTKAIGVVKYESNPDHRQTCDKKSRAQGNPYFAPFPSFIPKTDETRVQKLPGTIRRLAGTPVYSTEKLDGSSMTVYLTPKGRFGVCSRNIELLTELPKPSWFKRILQRFSRRAKVEGKDNPKNGHFWQKALKLGLEDRLRRLQQQTGQSLALQGELVGPSIQGNNYKLADTEFYVFTVFDLAASRQLGFDEMNTATSILGLNMVPVLEKFPLPAEVKDIVSMAEGASKLARTKREGIVIRSLTDTGKGILSFKAISPAYLLAHDA